MRIYNKLTAFILALILIGNNYAIVFGEGESPLNLTSKSGLLMEASTGKILYENNSHEQLLPASVTKVMSLLLIMEALDSGKIKLTDKISVSEYAASMGGSQVYLEPGEQMSIYDMLKAIAVSSANDATVAMAENIAGSEQAFVRMMNEKAKVLGMNDTVFYNTTGLDDTEPYNITSAHDIALMSRELIKYPKIFDYTTIWIDSLRNGKFGLSNTNKLVKFYPGTNGLKTGSTSKAKYNLSATAKRDDMQLIATVMCGPNSAERFADAKKMLDYGFANYKCILIAKKGNTIRKIRVDKGLYQNINIVCDNDINLLIKKGEETKIVPEVNLPEVISAPCRKGQKAGEIIYKVNNAEVARFDLVCETDVARINITNAFKRIMGAWIGA